MKKVILVFFLKEFMQVIRIFFEYGKIWDVSHVCNQLPDIFLHMREVDSSITCAKTFQPISCRAF